jgi:hypothetical protein
VALRQVFRRRWLDEAKRLWRSAIMFLRYARKRQA